MTSIKDRSIIDKYKENNKEDSNSQKTIKPKEALKHISERLHTSEEVIKQGCSLATSYMNQTNLRGVETMRIHLSAYYLSTGLLEEARSKRQIQTEYNLLAYSNRKPDSTEYSLRDIRRTSKRIIKTLDLENSFRTPKDYLNFWKKVIEFTEKEEELLHEIEEKVRNDISYNGYSPLPLSGSMVWLVKNPELDAETIADYAVSTDSTIRKNAESIFYDVTNDIDSTDFKSQNPRKKL